MILRRLPHTDREGNRFLAAVIQICQIIETTEMWWPGWLRSEPSGPHRRRGTYGLVQVRLGTGFVPLQVPRKPNVVDPLAGREPL